MSYEVNIAVQVRDNGAEGSLIAVSDFETLFPVPVDVADPGAVAKMWVAIFAQMELKLDTMSRAVTERAIQQVQHHSDLVKAGTHPVLLG